MARSAKFELSSRSPDEPGFPGSYPNVQRGNFTGANLGRSGSFRDSNDGRIRTSGTSTSKGSAAATAGDLRSSLMLEPIPLGDQKYRRSAELRRALNISFGGGGSSSISTVSQDTSLGTAHSKPQPATAAAELKLFRAKVRDSALMARKRAKRLDDSLNKLNKFCDVLNSKKPQTHERSGGPNLSKAVGNQFHRNPQDHQMAPKPDDRSKNVVLSKRARSRMADMRAEGRGNGIPRQHPGLVKEKDITKEGSLSSGLVKEKVRRLPAGEGWDNRMKRKRSMSNVVSRPVDGDGESKRTMQGRPSNDSGIQISDGHNFRSGSSDGSNVANKVEGTPSPASSSGRVTPKCEMEKASPSRELAGMKKERILQKGANKLNMREGNRLGNPCSMIKGKASRGPRVAGNSAPSFQRLPMVSKGREQPSNGTNGIHFGGEINRKRHAATESSSLPMAQWVVQRPQKISRTRRTNILPPASNYDEAHVSSQGYKDSEFSSRISSGVNGSLPPRNITSSTHQLKMKIENVPSPGISSESEDSGAEEHRLKHRAVGRVEAEERVLNGYQHADSSGLLVKKNKLLVKDESEDSVRREGRRGRVSSLSRESMSSLGEKLNDSAGTKPLRSTKPGSDKSGSKSGRPPLKKHLEQKHLTCPGPVTNCSSPDLTGESDDDREELLEAAQFARSASYHCSSSFWKEIVPLFSIRQEHESYLTQQLKSVEDHQELLSGSGDKAMNHLQDASQPQSICSEGGNQLLNNGFIGLGDLINEFQDNISSFGRTYYEKGVSNRAPLYHRVLSALIVEDEFEETEENGCERDAFLFSSEESSMQGNGVHCNGKTSYSRCSRNQISDEFWDNSYASAHSEAGATPATRQKDSSGSLFAHMNASGDLECQYAAMSINDKLLLELQSVGLYPETVPDLAEGGDELIDQYIVQPEKQLHQKIGNKKAHLERIHKAVVEQKKAERWDLEQVAMDRLSELAYNKLLATEGISGAGAGVSEVPKDIALAFIKRTLSKCHKFEDTGKSCFNEPPLCNIVLAEPPSSSIAEAVNVISPLDHNCQSEAKASDHPFTKNGPIVNRGKKKEVLLDDVGVSASLRAPLTHGNTIVGGAKGKRSKREWDKDLTRNTDDEAACPSVGNLRGERKAKSKPKQKVTQLSTHPVSTTSGGFGELVANSNIREREALTSPCNVPDSSKESEEILDFSNFPMPDLDTMGVLNMEFDEHQDIGSFLNFDDVNLQDHDSVGLEIPTDDLSELFFQG